MSIYENFICQPSYNNFVTCQRLTNEEEISAKEGRECDNFLNAFDVFVLIMKFAQSNCNQIDNKFKLKLVSLDKHCSLLFLNSKVLILLN